MQLHGIMAPVLLLMDNAMLRVRAWQGGGEGGLHKRGENRGAVVELHGITASVLLMTDKSMLRVSGGGQEGGQEAGSDAGGGDHCPHLPSLYSPPELLVTLALAMLQEHLQQRLMQGMVTTPHTALHL